MLVQICIIKLYKIVIKIIKIKIKIIMKMDNIIPNIYLT